MIELGRQAKLSKLNKELKSLLGIQSSPATWQDAFDRRFVMSTDNGSGPEFMFRDNGDNTLSIAQLDDVKRFIVENVEK